MIELKEKVCFLLENDIPTNEILAVVSAIQRYRHDAYERIKGWNSIYPHKQKKSLDLTITACCDNLEYRDMLMASIEGLQLVRLEDVKKNIREYEMVRHIGHTIAYHFAYREKHASQVYGILVGSEAPAFPNLSNWLKPSDDVAGTDVVFAVDDMELAGVLSYNVKLPDGLETFQFINEKELSLQTIAATVNRAKMVIGKLGFATYVAGVLGKAVFEIYPSTMPMNWLTKWSCGAYGIVLESPVLNLRAIKLGIARVWQIKCNKEKANQKAEELVAVE